MSAAPTPSLFDEGLARRVESLFAAVGCSMAVAITLAHLVVGEPVRFLYPFERLAVGLLALVMVWRYRHRPMLAGLLLLATLFLATRVAWFEASIPHELLLAVHAVVIAALIARSALPRALRVAACLMAVVLGALSTLTPDFESWVLILWGLGALGSRSAPPPPAEGPMAGWKGGTGRWWFYFRLSVILGAFPFAFWVFSWFIPDARSWMPVAGLVGTGVMSLQLAAWVSMLRRVDGIHRSTFWSGLREVAFVALGVCTLSATLQIYELVLDADRWLAYILSGESLFMVLLTCLEVALAVLVLRSSGPTPRAGRAKRRVMWASLLLVEKMVTFLLYAAWLAYDPEQQSPVLAAFIFSTGLLGQACWWGLLATLHHDIEEASMAETFSSEPGPSEA